MNFLKPNKANIIGTVLLLVANFMGGFISRVAVPLIIPRTDSNGSIIQGMGQGGRGSFGAGVGMYGNSGFASSVINVVILAILFYVILSFVVDQFVSADQKMETPVDQPKSKKEVPKSKETQ